MERPDCHRKWLEIGIVVTLGILLSLGYYFPILSSGNNLGIQDWDQNFAWTEATRVSLLDYHQFPLWNPYKCGGTVQFANPQVPVLSIQTALALILGTLRGIKLSIFVHGVIGFVGFYLLARQYKLTYIGSALAAIIFSFSGITSSFLSSGMVVFTNFAYTPYILIFFNKSIDKGKWGIVAGILFAVSFYYSYQIPLLIGVYLLVYTVVKSIAEKTAAPIKAFIILVFTSGVLILPKLFFATQLLRISPRQLSDISGYSIQNFLYFLLSRKQNLFNEMDVQGYYYAIDENSLYVGILAFALFLLFFARNKKEIGRNAALIITLLIMIWLALGSGVHPSIYAVLRRLPLFSSFRVAQRFRFDLIIPFSLIAGLGVDNLIHLLPKHKLALILAIVCPLIVYADLAIFSTTNFLSKTLIITNPETQLWRSDHFVQTGAVNLGFEIRRTIEIPEKYLDSNIFIPWSFEYLKIKQNNGVLDCYDPIPLGVKALGAGDENYQGEFHLVDTQADIAVENTFWSPNRLIFKLINNGMTPNNTLIVNQNFYPGWVVVKDGKECKRATNTDGLLFTQIEGTINSLSYKFSPIAYYLRCK